MTSKNGAEAMQHLLIGIIAVILSCLFSLGGSWFVWGSQAVNRDEVKKIVNVHAP